MSKLKFITLNLFLMLFVANVSAQNRDSVAKKSSLLINKTWPSFSNPFKKNKPASIVTDQTKLAAGTIEESLSQVAKKTTLSVITGVQFSKQAVSANGYTSVINYNISENNNDLLKPGFFAGLRMDGSYHQQHDYSLSVSVNKLNTGIGYTSFYKMPPYIGKFSSFKGEENLWLLNLAAHYKKMLPIGDRVRYQLYAIAGPSLDVNFGGFSLDNQVADKYNRLFFKGDIGLEFYNRSNYNLFFHYHHSLSSLTSSPVSTSLSGFEMGVMVKAKDLF